MLYNWKKKFKNYTAVDSDSQDSQGVSASEMTYIVLGGALNYSLTLWYMYQGIGKKNNSW